MVALTGLGVLGHACEGRKSRLESGSQNRGKVGQKYAEGWWKRRMV